MSDQNRMSTALLVSLMLHVLLLAMLKGPLFAPRAVKPEDSLLDVDVVNLPPPAPKVPAAAKPQAPAAPPQASMPESKIVPMPDDGVEQKDDRARFLSDRDNVVQRQQVKRGDNWESQRAARAGQPDAGPADAAAARAPAVESKTSKKVAVVPKPRAADTAVQDAPKIASLPKLDQLLPQGGDFEVAANDSARPEQRPAAQQPPARRNLMPGRQGALSGRPGVAAYLPTVQEGDITLLNTKASQFAPFVRRVAARVFQHLEIRLRQEASARVAGAGREYAEVEAVMSPSGEFLNAILKDRKSETQLAGYRLLLGATNREVFFDRNPPPGAAAADGNIHFILMMDLNVEVGTDPGTGRQGTGYWGVAGVGLQ